MRDQKVSFIPPQLSRSGKPLVLVIEPHRSFGTSLAQILMSETSSYAILATSIAEAHTILQHFHCDALLLYHSSFSHDELNRLPLLPKDAEMPPLTLLAGLPLALDQQETWNLENLVKSIQFVRCVRHGFDKEM